MQQVVTTLRSSINPVMLEQRLTGRLQNWQQHYGKVFSEASDMDEFAPTLPLLHTGYESTKHLFPGGANGKVRFCGHSGTIRI
jgi:hypothetical protein